jgi:hypothetical protein
MTDELKINNGDIHWLKNLAKADHIKETAASGILEMIAEKLEARADNWQPIETAPKDGRRFLRCVPKQMNLIGICRFSRVHKVFQIKRYGYWDTIYLHEGEFWQPLPEPPKES